MLAGLRSYQVDSSKSRKLQEEVEKMSLLHCSVCKSPLNIHGKRGAIFHTSCSTCGSDSGPMITAAEKRQSDQYIQVIRKKTLPRRRMQSTV